MSARSVIVGCFFCLVVSACLDFARPRFASTSHSPSNGQSPVTETMAEPPAQLASQASAVGPCDNGRVDYRETDVDCGGPDCPSCNKGRACVRDEDCQTLLCDVEKRCSDDVCHNGKLDNGEMGLPNEETDVDCGGPNCRPCPTMPSPGSIGFLCHVDRDCESLHCEQGYCRMNACANWQRDGDESDVDCGGPLCRKCPPTKRCATSADCWNGDCEHGVCTRTCPSDMSDVSDGDHYCIDNHEVSVGKYVAWLQSPAISERVGQQELGCGWNRDFAIHRDASVDARCQALSLDPSDADLPVRCVDWCQASAFCSAQGKALCGTRDSSHYPGQPIEIEPSGVVDTQWYYACTTGAPASEPSYPYGATYQRQVCHGGDDAIVGPRSTVPATDNACHGQAPLDAVFELSGNVAEWEGLCRNQPYAWWEPFGTKHLCSVRGGSFEASEQAALSCESITRRLQRNAYAADVGFRCCTQEHPD